MQKLFKTIDGEIFESESKARDHENDLLEKGLLGLQLDVDDFLASVPNDNEDYHCSSTFLVVKTALISYLDGKIKSGMVIAGGKLYPGGGNTPVVGTANGS